MVPSSISDNVLNYSKTYRSRARIPVLTYLHPVNNASITRCSQPMVGVRGNRSAQDEKLVAAIWSTSRPARPTSKSAPTTPRGSRSVSDLTKYAERASVEEHADAQPDVGVSVLNTACHDGTTKAFLMLWTPRIHRGSCYDPITTACCTRN